MNPPFGSMALLPVEQMINRVLQGDAHLRRRLAPFAGKSLELVCTSPPLSLTVLFETDHLRLQAVAAADLAIEADASIKASARDLISLLVAAPESRPLANPAVEIRGDSEFVQDLYLTLNKLDIQWEDYLAPVLGDVVSNELGRFARDLQQWSDSTRRNMKRNIDEYIKEEARWVPGRDRVDRFGADLDRLKLRIDRVAARADLIGRRLDELSD